MTAGEASPTGRKTDVLDAVNRVLGTAITCETEEELGRACLAVAERLTGSRFGFIGELNDRGRLDTIAISDPGWEACRMDCGTGHGISTAGMEVRGIYGRVLLEGKGFFTNDPSSHPDRVGTPPGHPALTSFLGVPLRREGKTTGIIGLGNREGGYVAENQEDAEALAPVIVETLVRKRAEVALRESREALDRAQAVAHTGSWRLDVRKDELVWSDENHRIFGVPKGTPMSYETFLGIVHPDDREYVDRMWKAGLRGEPYDIEHRIVADGRVKWVRERAELELDKDGTLLGGFGTTQDVTERKLAESALRKALDRNSQQEKLAAIGRLAGGVAHEIRNPLSAMKNAVYYLNMALDRPDPAVAETLALLDREIARSESVISSLLGLAHPGRTTRSEVDVNRSVREALGERPPAGVEVRTELDAAIPAVRADPAQLAIVFGNIIRNSYEAMPGGGRLTVSSCSDAGWVSVSVTDTGTGIRSGDLRRIFEPLVTTKEGGTGLGLPMAKALVEGHGGSIEVESEPGKGSTFTVRLPVKTKPGPGA